MALREGLSEQEAYSALVDIPADEVTRDLLVASAASAPGTWRWTTLPDGSGLGIIAPADPASPGWAVNHVTP